MARPQPSRRLCGEPGAAGKGALELPVNGYERFQIAENYAKSQDHENAAYCYTLAFDEINFYISLSPDSAKAHHIRGLLFLNASEYLGLERQASLDQAREDFSTVLTSSPEYAQGNDIRALIDRANDLLQ
jgi:hypothetical protein